VTLLAGEATRAAAGRTEALAVGSAVRGSREGPAEVTREQRERIVTSMMQVRVSAAGVPAEPEASSLADAGKDEWETWNRQRDATARP